MEVILRNMVLSFVAGISLLLASSIQANTEIEKKLGIRVYGSFLYSEKVPNALFFFSDIEKNDSFELRKALRNHDIEILVLSSRGGSVWEGLNMAGIIYDKKLITYVPKLGLSSEGNCASACAFMFFGGSTRIADGKLGVHQFYSGSAYESANVGESQGEAQFAVSEIIGFLNEFETPPFVYERMFQQSEMYYFDDKEMEQIKRVNVPIKQSQRSKIDNFINDFIIEVASLTKEVTTPKTNDKSDKVTEEFITSYYTFPDNFTAKLKGSNNFAQINVVVTTQYDEVIMENVERHRLILRPEILKTLSDFSIKGIEGKKGRDRLAEKIKQAVNVKLESLEGYGGVEGVHFTSFVIQ